MGDVVKVSPVGPAEDRGKAVIIIFWVQLSLAMTTVAARFWARYIIKRFGRDDWLMLFTLVYSHLLNVTIASN